MRYIPNLITSLNLISGFAAIILTAGGDMVSASWMILAAMIFDFLDGFSARLLKAYSAIGKELDSLADVVSFGVAPGFLIFQMLKASFAGSSVMTEQAGLITVLIFSVSAIMPVCGAMRLAVFNVDTSQATTFKGLPIPANGIAVISVVLAAHYSGSELFSSILGSPVILILYTLVLSFLMVSRIPLLSLKVSNLKVKGNEGRYILISLILILFIIFGIAAAPLIVPVYIISSLLSLLF
jgi:CDP-diacylglycerol---serine O-phosphatidyltransferase